MKRAILVFSAVGAIMLFVSAWPDIRRYMRMRAM
jgi:hypothetical protein